MDEQLSAKAKQALGGKGTQLHTHEMHVRRTENKGYVAKHHLADKNGNPPSDGQRSEKEYSLANKAELLKHVAQHMGDMEPDENDQQAAAAPPPGAAGAAPGGGGEPEA